MAEVQITINDDPEYSLGVIDVKESEKESMLKYVTELKNFADRFASELGETKDTFVYEQVAGGSSRYYTVLLFNICNQVFSTRDNDEKTEKIFKFISKISAESEPPPVFFGHNGFSESFYNEFYNLIKSMPDYADRDLQLHFEAIAVGYPELHNCQLTLKKDGWAWSYYTYDD